MRVIGFYFDILSRIVLSMLVGLVIGYGLAWAINTGYFQTWRQMPSPPAKATALLTAVRDDLSIQSTNDQTYRCTEWLDECWIPESAPNEIPAFDVATRPCVSSSPEFFLLTNAPRNVTDCLQVISSYPDGYGRSAYILDRDGQIWAWSHLASAYSMLTLIYLLSVLGLICGFSMGVVWAKRSAHRPSRN